MTQEEKRLKRKRSYYYLLVLSVFSVACFFTAMFLSSKTSEPVLKAAVASSGGEVGPFQVKRDNSVYKISVESKLKLNTRSTWGFIEGELLNANKEFLMGFGGEMWKERDSEGTYEETAYELDLTIAQKGTYYLKFKSEYKDSRSAGPIVVKIKSIRGNSHLHFFLGVIALIIVFVGRMKVSSPEDVKAKGSGKKDKINIIQWAIVAVFVVLVFLTDQC